jgi:hypothetical protein
MQNLHKLFGFLVAALTASPKYELLKDHRQIAPLEPISHTQERRKATLFTLSHRDKNTSRFFLSTTFIDLQNRTLAVPTHDTFRVIFYLFCALD